MIEIKNNDVRNYVMDGMAWKVDLVALLHEIATATPHAPYIKCFNILSFILKILGERATEINDPALNIIMLNLGMYENSHAKDIEIIKDKLREIIKQNSQQ